MHSSPMQFNSSKKNSCLFEINRVSSLLDFEVRPMFTLGLQQIHANSLSTWSCTKKEDNAPDMPMAEF